LETDLRNAGTQSVDKSVVADGRVVTSRKPDDLADFCREMLKVFSEAGRRAA
jgi:protease I